MVGILIGTYVYRLTAPVAEVILVKRGVLAAILQADVAEVIARRLIGAFAHGLITIVTQVIQIRVLVRSYGLIAAVVASVIAIGIAMLAH